METIQHSISINASKEKVWEILWTDKTLRDWANIIDEGTYLVGDLKEGNEVNFISGSNQDGDINYGVTSKVEKLTPGKYILFKHIADITVNKDGSIKKRDPQWTGGYESYELEENENKVKLTITDGVPTELVELFNKRLPEVLERIKTLSEIHN